MLPDNRVHCCQQESNWANPDNTQDLDWSLQHNLIYYFPFLQTGILYLFPKMNFHQLSNHDLKLQLAQQPFLLLNFFFHHLATPNIHYTLCLLNHTPLVYLVILFLVYLVHKSLQDLSYACC